MVSARNKGYDTHFIVLYDLHITLQAHLYDILPPDHIILTVDQPDFVLNYMLRIRQGRLNYQFEIFGLTQEGYQTLDLPATG